MVILRAARNSIISGVIAMAGIAVFAIAALVTVDVVLRYLFNAPSKWIDEIATYLVVVTILLGLAYAQRERAHIKVDVLIIRLPKVVQRWLELSSLVVFLAYTLLLLYLTTQSTVTSARLSTTSGTLINIPIAPWQAFMPVGLLMLAVVLIGDIYNRAKGK